MDLKHQRFCLVTFLFCFGIIQAVYVPPDVEILDGYEFDDSPEYYPSEPSYFEAKSLMESFSKSIRNKRSSHANIKGSEQIDVDSEKIEVLGIDQEKIVDKKEETRNKQEHLPKPEKQVIDPAELYFGNRRSFWNDEALSLGKSLNDDADSIAEADGYKGRQAQVNFVTQTQKKDNEIPKDYSHPILSRVVPPMPRYDTKHPTYANEMYPSKSYDPYLRRYDRFDDQYNRFDPYGDYYVHRRYYDPFDYSPRLPQYPDPFYMFPDRQYDVPEPRDLKHRIVDPFPSQFPTHPNQNRSHRRIVYYAHLPEIVRGAKAIDFNRNGDSSRFDGLLTPSGIASRIGEVYKNEKSAAFKKSSKSGSGFSSSAAQDYVQREKKDQKAIRQ